MLTAVRQSDGKKVLARDCEKVDAPFACPGCHRELILRKGQIKIHHFAHKPPITCMRGSGETEQHLRAKLAVFDALSREPNVMELELEKDFGVSVADVYARISGIPVAIEIQRSALSVNDISVRTKNYHRLGVVVLWVGLWNVDLMSQKYSPRAWEKWVHALYFGRIYYWESGQTFRVVHLNPYGIYVPESHWYEQGLERSSGGYERISKRWKTPRAGVPVLLSQSFQSNFRRAWKAGTVDIPECTVYIDTQSKWWS